MAWRDERLEGCEFAGRLKLICVQRVGGFTIPAAASTYWVGDAMNTLDYDLAGPKPDITGKATRTLAANAAHLARLLNEDPYPPT